MKEIKKVMPLKTYGVLERKNIEEIRIRENKPLCIRVNNKIIVYEDILITRDDIKEIIEKSTKYSYHSYIENIKQGFLTLDNGHRVGICGDCAVLDGQIVNIKNITSLNIRIAKKVDEIPIKIPTDSNILVVSKVNLGKTTLLRKIISDLSKENKNISVIDERFEITSGFDLGVNVDVITGVFKKKAVMMMLKTMSPDFLVLDEITEDIDILQEIGNCGSKIIATIHGEDFFDIKKEVLDFFDYVIEIKFLNYNREYFIKRREDYV